MMDITEVGEREQIFLICVPLTEKLSSSSFFDLNGSAAVLHQHRDNGAHGETQKQVLKF